MSTIDRFSRIFAPTLKETPAEATAASHRLLVRAGFIRQLGAGLYSYLPLGWRSVRKIEQILRHEMDLAGGQEVLLPALQPAELWRESGRWDEVDQTMFRLRDRRDTDYCLGMTHEEAMTDLARRELSSYRQLPQLWYQIGPKFRDEPRPRGGLLRVREFLMKDAYSFDADEAGLDRAFAAMRQAYTRIYARCGVQALAADAFSGAMGGRDSTEFLVESNAGEDSAIHCNACAYVANLEVAASRVACAIEVAADGGRLETFPTPGVRTIEALAAPPFCIPARRQLKTLVYVADGDLVLAVVRGDDMLNEAKLQRATQAGQLRPAETEEIVGLLGAHPGSLGAVGVSGAPVLVDRTLAGCTNMVTGANMDDVHWRGVDVERDIMANANARWADVRTVQSGEGCPACEGSLRMFPALEVGHIFKLGTRYSEKLGARILGPDGVSVHLVMGSYGIGVGRLLAAIVEANHDDDGIVWPPAVAPYTVCVVQIGGEAGLGTYAEQVSARLAQAGLDVLYDDRDERAGVKFKDADLIGIPWRVTVGRRGLADGTVEWIERATRSTRVVPVQAIGELAREAAALVRG
jgi:prolyl-tRNA synthetase